VTYDSAQDCRDSYTVALSEMARICERGWTCPANDKCGSKGNCLARMRCLDGNVTLGRDCSLSGGHCTSVYCLRSCAKI
jgi:hypothetical protein